MITQKDIEIQNLCAVFFDAILEGTKKESDLESWMIKANAPGNILNWKSSIAQFLPPKTYKGDYTINSLESLKEIAGYSHINGSLSIIYFKSPTLEGLESLKTIDGIEFRIIKTELKSIDLPKLQSIKGYLSIDQNSKLENIDELDSLTNIGTSLLITSNENLKTIDGLNNIKEVNFLSIENNEKLKSINGINSLEKTKNSSVITNNASLENINGLTNLVDIEDDFELKNNTILESIQGLTQLEYIKENFIFHNNLIESTEELTNLKEVGIFYTEDYSNDIPF
jgi:hypothetical protein